MKLSRCSSKGHPTPWNPSLRIDFGKKRPGNQALSQISADSESRRNAYSFLILRHFVVDPSSRFIFEYSGSGIQVELVGRREVGAVGLAFAGDAVEALVLIALLGGVAIGEVDVESECFFEYVEASDFKGIVKRKSSSASPSNSEEALDEGTVYDLDPPIRDGCGD